MALDASTFEAIVPSRYITFTIPFPPPRLLRVSVLDSPNASGEHAEAATAAIGAVWVPLGRASDWIFTTFAGHLQLLLSCPTSHPLSRLVLISDSPLDFSPMAYDCKPYPLIRPNVTPLLLALAPKSAFVGNDKLPDVPILAYEDEVVKGAILEICEGSCVGEMLIENVELGRTDKGVMEFRRRLRFKRMPNLVQTQMRIIPKNDLFCEELGSMNFELDDGVLVHPYLSPMVAGISVISSYLDGRVRDGWRPKALCLGVGGGALVKFLGKKLDFEVVGVEIDAIVLEIAERYFGLVSDELICLHVGDGIEFLSEKAKNVGEDRMFDVIMVDLDSDLVDASTGFHAPSLEFVRKSVLMEARAVLHEFGVLIINVIPTNESYYQVLVDELQEVFEELYEIDVGKEENFVLIAAKSKVKEDNTGYEYDFISNKLEGFVQRSHIDCIRKVSKMDSHVHEPRIR